MSCDNITNILQSQTKLPSKLKTSTLIHSLSKQEQSFLEKNVIKNHKRKTLITLYKTLKKSPAIEKEELYKKVFRENYNNTKDTLLRNELRLLNNAIELFLVKEKRRLTLDLKSLSFQIDLLEIHLAKRNDKLFEQLWRKCYKKATEERFYREKIHLTNLWFEYKSNKEEFEFEIYNELRQTLALGLADTLAEMQEQFKKIEVKYAFTERVMRALNVQYTPSGQPLQYKIHQPLENQDLITYLDQLVANYHLDGLEKIEAGEKALAHADVIYNYTKYEILVESVVLLKANLGLEYFLLRKYEKANHIYLTVLADSHTIPVNKQIAFFYNYFVNLICLDKYEEAIVWKQKNQSNWVNNPATQYRIHLLSCWCYIFQEDYNTPLQLLSDSAIYERPENDFLYAKILLTIINYHQGDLELAERELYNLKQKNRYQRPIEEVYIHYARLLYRHLQALKEINTTKRNRRLDKLAQELDAFYQSELGYNASELYYKWYQIENTKARL